MNKRINKTSACVLLFFVSGTVILEATEKTDQKISHSTTKSAPLLVDPRMTFVKTSEQVKQFAGQWVLIQTASNYFVRKEISAVKTPYMAIGHISDRPLHVDESCALQTGHDFKRLFSKQKCDKTKTTLHLLDACVLTTRSIQSKTWSIESREAGGIFMRLADDQEIKKTIKKVMEGKAIVENMSQETAIKLLRKNILRHNHSAPDVTLAESRDQLYQTEKS